MAIKEFIISPENYFEDEFFDGDYTERQNQSFSTLTCNANRIVSIQIETGVYFAEGYFDGEYTERQSQSFATLVCEIDKTVGFLFQAGFYFEQGFIEDDFILVNSIVTTLEAEAMVVQEATINARDYFDGSYYEPGYYADSGSKFTFSIYLGQTVEAAGSISATATVDAVVGVVKSATANVSAEFSCTGTISHIEGADLFAFAEAALAAAVQASREYSASVDSIFDIATDYVRFRTASADADSEFTQSAEGARSRDFDSVIEAAVSLDSIINKTVNTVADTSSSFNLIVDAIIVQETEASLISNFTCSANAIEYIRKTPLFGRPIDLQPFRDVTFSSTVKKFGTHSLGVNNSFVFQDSFQTDSFAPLADEDFVVEGWVYIDNTLDIPVTSEQVYLSYGGTTLQGNASWSIGWAERQLINNTYQLPDFKAVVWRATDTGYVTLLGPRFKPPFATWFHIALKRSNGVISLWYNNVQQASANYSGAVRLNPTASSRRLFLNHDYTVGSGRIYYDSVRVARGDSTIRGYTEYPPNDFDTTVALYKMDDSLLDERGFNLSTSADLVSNSSLNVILGKTADAISLQASSGTLTANANVVNDAISNQSSEFQFVAEGEFVAQEATATIESASTLEVNAEAIRSLSSSIQCESTVNATATRIFDFNIETDSVAILLSAVAKVGDFLVTLENSAQLSADVVKTTDVNSTIEAVTAFVAQGDKTVAFEATIDASVDITIIGDRIRFADSDQTASFVHSITAIKNTQGAVNLDSAFDIEIDSAGLIRGNAALISNFNLDVNFDRTRNLNSNLNSEFAQTATGIKAVEADATLNSESTISITVLRIRSASTNFDSIAVQLAAVAKIGDFLIDCQTDSQLTVDAIKQAVGVTNIEVFAQQNTVIARTRDTDASLASEFTNVANVRTTTDVVADLDSNFEQSVTAQKIISAQVNISGAAQFAATVVATRNNEIQTFTQSQLTLTPSIIRNNSASIAAQANQTVTAQRVRTTASSINSTTAVTANGRIIVIDKYEYIIPREYREFAIHTENRQYRIVKENREHIVRG
jgi:hypothetical protein